MSKELEAEDIVEETSSEEGTFLNKELQLVLFGKPQIILDGKPLSIFHKAQALLYYLAVTGQSQERAELLQLLWSKIPEADARNNLRVTLSYLRKHLGDYLVISRYDVGFNAEAPLYYLDIEEFKTACQTSPKTIEHLEKIVELYQGTFLQGFRVPDEKDFQDWLTRERNQLRSLVIQTLNTLSILYKQKGDYTNSIKAANQILSFEPQHQEAQQLLASLSGGENFDTVGQTIYADVAAASTSSASSTQSTTTETTKPASTPKATTSKKRPREYRQITGLYCHWRESEMIHDPHVWYIQRQKHQQQCEEVIRQFKGEVVQKDSSGLLAVFGYPNAFEESEQWAIEAGLSVLQTFTSALEFTEQKVAVGVNTGLAVVGGDDNETISIGQPLEIAEQLARHAESETLLIGESTHKLAHGYFECHPHGQLESHSIQQSVYRVAKETTAYNRIAVVKESDAEFTPLVNRDLQLGFLADKWNEALRGNSKALIIRGDEGMGKSRLIEAFIEEITARPPKRSGRGSHSPISLKSHCPPFYRNQVLYPIATLFQSLTNVYTEQALIDRLKNIASKVAEKYNPTHTQADLKALQDAVINLLSPASTLKNLEVGTRQKQVLDVLKTLLVDLSSQRPILLVVEDLQYADSLTLTLLSLLFEHQATEATLKLLVVVTARPETKAIWPDYAHILSFKLTRLSKQDSASLIEKLVADREVSDEVLEQLTIYSDGVPLFAEALADTWLNAEDLEFSIDNMTVPASLYDLLYTPLDGLGDNKRILQLGAALGQEFEYNALAALWDKDETTLQAGLEKLAELGLVYPRGQVPYATYQFKYKLMRVVAYQTLMRDQREALYARISQLGLNEEKGLEI